MHPIVVFVSTKELKVVRRQLSDKFNNQNKVGSQNEKEAGLIFFLSFKFKCF